MADMAWRSLRATSRILVQRKLDLCVEGTEMIPPRGPVIIAARHFHHLYDGCAMLATMPRPVHILVALDWVGSRPGRILMKKACDAASWPVVLRRDGATAVDDIKAARALRQATIDTMALLEDGRIILVFPEGYPNIDPGFTPKPDESAFLPFQPGVVRLASLAAQRGMRVPIVPAGFSYQRGNRWTVALRFGEPLTVEHRGQEAAILDEIEARVRSLSAPDPGRTNMSS
jgi:1-acyl-sn-glycerol-3-phosphate acyltransferase